MSLDCQDIALEVLTHVDNWRAWYACILTCREWYSASKRERVRNKRYQLTSFIRSLLSSQVDLEWDATALKNNRSIRVCHRAEYPWISWKKKARHTHDELPPNPMPVLHYLGADTSSIHNAWKEAMRKTVTNWPEIYRSKYVYPCDVLDALGSDQKSEWFEVHVKVVGVVYHLLGNPNLSVRDTMRIPSQYLEHLGCNFTREQLNEIVTDPTIPQEYLAVMVKYLSISHVRTSMSINHPCSALMTKFFAR